MSDKTKSAVLEQSVAPKSDVTESAKAKLPDPPKSKGRLLADELMGMSQSVKVKRYEDVLGDEPLRENEKITWPDKTRTMVSKVAGEQPTIEGLAADAIDQIVQGTVTFKVKVDVATRNISASTELGRKQCGFIFSRNNKVFRESVFERLAQLADKS